jgi:hypothetical protein
MNGHRRRYLLFAPVLGSIALAVGIGSSASAGTQTIGSFTVTDSVTQDATAGTTTATYTITRNDKHQLNQADVTIPSCTPAQVRTISHNGKVDQNDPSTKQAGPLIRWPANNASDPGHVFVYSYTVQGLFNADTETLAVKSGNNVSTGTVAGIGCSTGTSTVPGGGGGGGGTSTNTVGGNQVAGSQGVAGTQTGCVDRRKFTFKLHRFRKARITDVKVFVNNKRKLHKRGHDIRKVTIKRLPLGIFTIKVVSKQSTGSSLTSTRKYNGCNKGRPRTTGHHAHRHHH